MRFQGVRLKKFLFTVMFAGVLVCLPHAVYGAQKEIHFGSERYDARVLRCVAGADVDDGGSLTVSGETGEREMRRMLEFSLLSDDSSYLRLSQEDAAGETTVWAPVLAAGEDDSLSLLELQTKPDGIVAFDAEQRVYTLTFETPGELESVEAQAGDGVDVMLPDLAALHAGKNILTISLRDDSGRAGRYYLLVDVAGQEEILPAFFWEGVQWQVLDGETCAAACLAMPYETATYSLDGVSMDFICNAGREVFLVFAQSPEGEVSLFAYSLNDGSFYRCGTLATEQKNYYTIPLGALAALPSDYSVSLLTSQGVFAGMDEEGNIGLYLINPDGKLEEYVLRNQSVSAGDKTEAPENTKKSGGWLVLAVCLAVAAAGMSVAYRRFSDVRLLMGAAVSGFVMILAVGIWFLPRGNAEAEPVGSGGIPVTGSGQVSLQTQELEETEETEREEDDGNVIWGEVVGGESEPEAVTPEQNAGQGAGTGGTGGNNGEVSGNGNNGGMSAPPQSTGETAGNGWNNGGTYTPPETNWGGTVDTPPVTDDDGEAPPSDGGGGNTDTPSEGDGNTETPPSEEGVDTPPLVDDDGGAPPVLDDDGEAPPSDGGGGNTDTPSAGGGNTETPPADGGESVSGTEE